MIVSADVDSMSAVRTPSKPSRITTNFTVPFVNSVKNVFKKMVKVDTVIGEPREKSVDEPSHDVSAIIGMSGDVIGTVVVSFDQEAAIKLVEAFASEKVDPASPDFADAIGELANMIAGGAKKDLGVMVDITVPSVVIGKGHHIARLKNAACLVIPCSTPAGTFSIEVSLKQHH